MTKSLLTLLGGCLCASLLFSQRAMAATGNASASQAPGVHIAESVSTITGVAISPLLGTSAYGAVKYFRTAKDQRAGLPWFAQPWFWVPAFVGGRLLCEGHRRHRLAHRSEEAIGRC